MSSVSSTDRQWVGVLGATSLVGSSLLPLLVYNGWQVAAFSRSAPSAIRQPHVSWLIPGNKFPFEKNITCWLCLAPIWVLPDYFDWLVECGVKQITVLSSTSRFTKADSSEPLEQSVASKLANGEERLISWAVTHGIAWITLRPTLIYGFGKDKNISQIARMIRRFGFFPLLGEARGLRQPIHLLDLAAACIASLEKPGARNRAFNLSGAEVLSYREMVSRVFVALNTRPRFIKAPLWMFRILVALMRLLPRFRNWSPMMAERMNRDMVFDHSEATRYLGFSPRAFALGPEDLSL